MIHWLRWEPTTRSYAWKYSWGTVFSALQSFEKQQIEAGIHAPSYFFIVSPRSTIPVKAKDELTLCALGNPHCRISSV